MGFKCHQNSAAGTERAGEPTFGSTESSSYLSHVQGTSLQNGLGNRAPFKRVVIQILKHFWGPAAFCHALHENERYHVLHCICVCVCMPCWGIIWEKLFSFSSSCTCKQWRVLSAFGLLNTDHREVMDVHLSAAWVWCVCAFIQQQYSPDFNGARSHP